MKFQRMVRIPMMVVGLAAGLLVAKPVRAQQEVDPTFFDAPSNAATHMQADNSTSPSLPASNQAAAEPAAALAPQQVDASPAGGTVQVAIAVLLTGFGFIVFPGIGKAMRGEWRQIRPSLRESPAPRAEISL